MRYQSYERPITLFDLTGSLSRYRGRFIAVTLTMLIVSAVAILVFPKRYESEAKLLVRLGRASAALDPATFGQTISIQESRESEMNSIVDLLTSRGLAERVVDEVGVENILKRHAWIERVPQSMVDSINDGLSKVMPASSAGVDGSMTEEEYKNAKRRELAIKEFMSVLKINSPKKSTTITISYRGASAETAHEVVQSLVTCYKQMHIDAYRSGGSFDFFDKQFTQQDEKLKEREQVLRAAKNEYLIITTKGKQESLQSEITDVKKMQLQTIAEMEAMRARVESLEKDMSQLPEEMVSEKTSGKANASSDAMRDRLYELEIREKDLESKFVSTHPELQKVREQLATAREIMDQQPTEREESTLAVNPVRLEIQKQKLDAEASLASLSAKVEALKSLEEQLTVRLNEVNNFEAMSEAIEREIAVSRENYQNYARKLEESRINGALDSESLSNVSVVSPASMNVKNVSPKRTLLAILAIAMSVCCGMAVAIVSDFQDKAKETASIHEAERRRYLQEVERESIEAELAALEAKEVLALKKRELEVKLRQLSVSEALNGSTEGDFPTEPVAS